MPSIAILPWLHLAEPITIEPFELIPAAQYVYADTDEQQLGVSVLARHWVTGQPFPEHATLLRYARKRFTEDLSESERDALFDFVELLAFAGLSTRQFFGMGYEYWNRDNFQPYLFQLTWPLGGISTQVRQRDGSRRTGHSFADYKARKPPYVSTNHPIAIDLVLLNALQAAYNNPGYRHRSNISESIENYNQANTDRTDFRERVELVLLVGAFQRLLGVEQYVHHLVTAFMQLFAPKAEYLPSACVRYANANVQRQWQRNLASRTIRETWLRDLYSLRGKYAHGHVNPGYEPSWSLRNHLLLASYSFPLLVKSYLARDGYYTLTEDDRTDIDVFEELACAEHFEAEPESGRPWTAIHAQARFDRLLDSLRNLDDPAIALPPDSETT